MHSPGRTSAWAEVREQFRVRGITRENGRVTGAIGPHRKHGSADLTAGADGLHSVVARDLEARCPRAWPRRLGLTAHVTGIDWPEDTGQMHFGSNGYVGTAQLDNRCRLTIGLEQPLPRGRIGPSTTALYRVLRSAYPELHKWLSHGTLDGHITGTGPMAMRVRRAAGPGYALVGDAAGFVDLSRAKAFFRALCSG